MSDQDNIFTKEPQTNEVQTSTDPSVNNTVTDPSYDFIGEGQKYGSIDEALKSVPHAQAHIERLEQELSEFRENKVKSKTVEDILEVIGTTKASEPVNQPAQELDVDKLREMITTTVSSELTAKEIATVEQANVSKVINKMSEIYGEKAEAQFISAAKDSGLSVEAMNQLAAKSPEAVFKLTGIGLKAKDNMPDMSSGSVNTGQFNTNTEEELSAKVPAGATSKQLRQAWVNAGKKINRS